MWKGLGARTTCTLDVKLGKKAAHSSPSTNHPSHFSPGTPTTTTHTQHNATGDTHRLSPGSHKAAAGGTSRTGSAAPAAHLSRSNRHHHRKPTKEPLKPKAQDGHPGQARTTPSPSQAAAALNHVGRQQEDWHGAVGPELSLHFHGCPLPPGLDLDSHW
jgi:hypothetical protein